MQMCVKNNGQNFLASILARNKKIQ